MRFVRFALLFLLGVVLTPALTGLSVPARAADASSGIVVSHPWSSATPGHIANGVAFLTVTNHGAEADRLVGASTPVADKAELHTHLMEDGIMKMRPVEAIDIAPGATVELKPGGLHVMLLGLKAPLTEGQTYPLTLTFAKAGTVTVEVAVTAIGAKQGAGMPAMNMDHMDMDHSHQ
jgi:periplasmic copper chaperone A